MTSRKTRPTHVVRKLYADGRIENVEEDMSLQQLQAFVGGYIEFVATVIPHRALIVNEEGAVMTPPLPINSAATDLVRPGVLMLHGIHGDALLVKS